MVIKTIFPHGDCQHGKSARGFASDQAALNHRGKKHKNTLHIKGMDVSICWSCRENDTRCGPKCQEGASSFQELKEALPG